MPVRRGSVVLGAGIAAVLCVPLAVSVAASATDEKLLSRGHLTLASSELSGGYTASMATDGDEGTRWSSASGPGSQWLRIDLGAPERVDRVVLNWARWYATSYRVQISADGSNWRDLYATRTGDGGTDDLKRLTGTGRYLRVLALRRGHPESGYSLTGADVYGPGPAAPVVERDAPDARLLASGLENGRKKETALEMVASAENSTLDWRAQYGYLEDLHDGRGYTGGIVGFCSGTDDMLALVTEYTRREASNPLARYLPALRAVDGSDSHAGLDPGFVAAWRAAAADPVFQKAQDDERDETYFDPSVRMAVEDGLRGLGQFIYFDASVMHGTSGMRAIRAVAMRKATVPAQGGDEIAYLTAFLTARVAQMRREQGHSDTTRIDTEQRPILNAANLDLNAPLSWKVYGDAYDIG